MDKKCTSVADGSGFQPPDDEEFVRLQAAMAMLELQKLRVSAPQQTSQSIAIPEASGRRQTILQKANYRPSSEHSYFQRPASPMQGLNEIPTRARPSPYLPVQLPKHKNKVVKPKVKKLSATQKLPTEMPDAYLLPSTSTGLFATYHTGAPLFRPPTAEEFPFSNLQYPRHQIKPKVSRRSSTVVPADSQSASTSQFSYPGSVSVYHTAPVENSGIPKYAGVSSETSASTSGSYWKQGSALKGGTYPSTEELNKAASLLHSYVHQTSQKGKKPAKSKSSRGKTKGVNGTSNRQETIAQLYLPGTSSNYPVQTIPYTAVPRYSSSPFPISSRHDPFPYARHNLNSSTATSEDENSFSSAYHQLVEYQKQIEKHHAARNLAQMGEDYSANVLYTFGDTSSTLKRPANKQRGSAKRKTSQKSKKSLPATITSNSQLNNSEHINESAKMELARQEMPSSTTHDLILQEINSAQNSSLDESNCYITVSELVGKVVCSTLANQQCDYPEIMTETTEEAKETEICLQQPEASPEPFGNEAEAESKIQIAPLNLSARGESSDRVEAAEKSKENRINYSENVFVNKDAPEHSNEQKAPVEALEENETVVNDNKLEFPENVSKELPINQEIIEEEMTPEEITIKVITPEEITTAEVTPKEITTKIITPEEIRRAEIIIEEITPEEITTEKITPEDIIRAEMIIEEITPEEIRTAEIIIQEIKPEEITTAEITPEEIRTAEIIIEEIKPEEITTVEITPEEIRTAEIIIEEIKPEEITTVEITPEEITLEEVTLEDITIEEITPEEMNGEFEFIQCDPSTFCEVTIHETLEGDDEELACNFEEEPPILVREDNYDTSPSETADVNFRALKVINSALVSMAEVNSFNAAARKVIMFLPGEQDVNRENMGVLTNSIGDVLSQLLLDSGETDAKLLITSLTVNEAPSKPSAMIVFENGSSENGRNGNLAVSSPSTSSGRPSYNSKLIIRKAVIENEESSSDEDSTDETWNIRTYYGRKSTTEQKRKKKKLEKKQKKKKGKKRVIYKCESAN